MSETRSIVERIDALEEETKVVHINAGTRAEPVDTTWKIRFISEAELDQIRGAASRHSRTPGDVDARTLRRLVLQKGIVAGPENWRQEEGKDVPWKGSKEDVDTLLAAWPFASMLYEAIQEFTFLDEEDYRGFP